MTKEKILIGTFAVNDWISNDFKGFSFQRANKGEAKHKFCVMLNPYVPITECGVIPKKLQVGDKIKDVNGVILKVSTFGSAGLFGKDSFSWIWVYFYATNAKFGG